ncbi:MAG: hypothetical protein JNN06_12840 [Gemmobacter sp.]|nr:hypothetical protein [Gemmobacter sp.]MBL8563155.1 hypothetical protein [Gemmobacter sp.]
MFLDFLPALMGAAAVYAAQIFFVPPAATPEDDAAIRSLEDIFPGES